MAWTFDIRTALFLGAFLSLLIGVLLLVVRRSVSGGLQPSLRWWIAGTLLYPVGFTLIALRGVIDDLWTAVVSNMAIAAAFACFAVALRVFNGGPQRRTRLGVLVVLVAATAAYFTFWIPDLSARTGWISALDAILLGSSARAIYRRGQALSAAMHVTGFLFVFSTVLMILRSGQHLILHTGISTVFTPTPMQVTAFGFGGLLPVIGTVGFLLMCTERSQQELASAARLDYLTGICNRRAIEDLASRAIAAARRHGMPLAMMIIDVDHFKRINDEHGHEAGDQALIETVRRIRDSLRAEDLVGRLGGEEFVAVMPNTDAQSALAAAGRTRQAFADAPMFVSGSQVRVTVSVGVAVLVAEDAQFSHLLRRADRAMYAAKAAGRNRVMLDGAET
ncbi:GGDEF domain-containing protein [Arenimonas oryziterrae]|uniref:diguanylate cyclase n=1 Tax=Arenimonas oryziterrae DSM 21050 = YC6267 TaxID=1121015 RepID=A0A091AYN6_9GAMM|nr:GGDEF domain-containing protein [Arenimonas oryziterrae]KFN43779.1 hypothetical protein N789_07490 [Arenimonas oryziterrae DSM 21050 = YC6267]